ncbi:galactose-1-phosphate uridylyltransferase [Amycolatopsis sp. NPDC059657]|uniref:galactose-1-phosphate uridylyltransferase n=1 Tax=Amycolatopsis sp. NPDC059657 TaxID=3346899 RepID=UPI00366E7000
MSVERWHGGELRWDHLTRNWVIVAPGRAARPHRRAGDSCPFCPGPDEDTPPETWRLPAGSGQSWRVRAVPNRYALSDRHEVVIESPSHGWDLATASAAEAADVLHAWQHRHRALREGTAQVVVFRNRGRAAGTSLSHSHSQVAGLPTLSPSARRELEALREHHRATGRRFADDLLDGALSSGDRIVFANDRVVASAPFAPVADFEVQLLPTIPRADFTAVPADELCAVALALRTVLGALRGELGDPAYNLVLNTAPTGMEDAPFLTWSLRIVPRLTIAAGLELATGIPVVTTPPERAAARLRARITHPVRTG